MEESAHDQGDYRDIWRIYKVPILLGFGSVCFLSISVALMIQATKIATPIEFHTGEDSGATVSDPASLSDAPKTVLIDIEGSVRHPGVFRLPIGSRVEDALTAAGGLASDADTLYLTRQINRAQALSDGMKLYIPSVNETSHNNEIQNNSIITSHNIDSIGTGVASAIVSINTDNQQKLETLPGVGPVTAQKIISNRPYQSLDELVSKKAVGSALFEKIKNVISL